MTPKKLVRYRRPLLVLFHLAAIPVGYYLAFALRFDFRVPEDAAALFVATVPWVVALRMACFAAFRLFQGWWRHVGMRDLIDLVLAVSASSLLLVMSLFFTRTLHGFPRSVVALDWLTAVFLFGGMRFAVRGLRENLRTLRGGARGKRALVVGAGEAAERLIREFQRDPSGKVFPLALLDDDPSKNGMRLHGVPVVGTTAELESVVARTHAELLVIAIPSATREEMRRLVERCMDTGAEFKIVPSLQELVDGRARLSQLRNVEIEDLLGREAVRLDLADVEAELAGRVVLVTGGAGSIGSELARQVARYGPRRLVLLDQAESPLYFIHLELERACPGLDVAPIIGSITDEARLEQLFAEHRPDFVLHAAAYKHVPLMEGNVGEAVRNNVFGTLRLAECAARHGVERFVLISTDKAVNPSSVMGATKRIAERIVLGWPTLRASRTDFRAVRFGNVLGSDGSVIPLFRRQLAAGQPLTVTHPEVTRYFMTIPEAVQLVLRAAALGEGAGRTCMLEMGEPVKVLHLAENLVRLSGLEPYRDVPIVFTGLRPGEKLFEELLSNSEETIPTPVEKVRIVCSPDPDADHLRRGIEALARASATGSRRDLLRAVRALVPECVPPLAERARAPGGERHTTSPDGAGV
ncbi:MAG TPA: nucleoside-diphosphate sugar epimerase/dehydratase, partial [Longimicrobium sp.]|nr:nucleoside-diphosphate sugar epimerase/dehydratase [Longimicrobium sp.]